MRRSFGQDGTPSDWEQSKQLDKLGHLYLPGASFVRIDRVTGQGKIITGNRSVLGRSTRGANTPVLLTTDRGTISLETAQKFKGLDWLLVNTQNTRGRRLLASVRQILQVIGYTQAVLILCSSPSELLALDAEETLLNSQFRFSGPPLRDLRGAVIEVGRDRLIAERSFKYAFEDLRGRSEELDRVIDLARQSWWAMRQVGSDKAPGEVGEYRRFLYALKNLRWVAPQDAPLLEQGRQLLEQLSQSAELARERFEFIAHLLVEAPENSQTLILARNAHAATTLQEDLAAMLRIDTLNLTKRGIQVQSFTAAPPTYVPDKLIVSGYFGLGTIDAILKIRANENWLTFDPVESLAAWFGLRKMKHFLQRVSLPIGTAWLEQVCEWLADSLPAEAEELYIELPSIGSINSYSPQTAASGILPEDAIIMLADGGCLEVKCNTRFEVLTFENEQRGGRLRAKLRYISANKLKSGDTIVLLHEDLRASFSQRVLATIDAGQFRELATQRSNWITLVMAFAGKGGDRIKAITKAMTERGEQVDEATVRSWITFTKDEEPHIPDRPERFLAFAEAIGIPYSREALLNYYKMINRLRIEHRRAGRMLTRIISATYFNRLDLAALAKVEYQYGLAARELVQGVRLATVDEVFT
jgi:hypothetical protein